MIGDGELMKSECLDKVICRSSLLIDAPVSWASKGMHFAVFLMPKSSLSFTCHHDAGQVYKLIRDSQTALKKSWSMHGANRKLEQIGDNMDFYTSFR